jgi:hypothetical protein
VVGGIAAEFGGGKFANGGMSAAFSRMFNDLGYPIGEDFSHSNGSCLTKILLHKYLIPR